MQTGQRSRGLRARDHEDDGSDGSDYGVSDNLSEAEDWDDVSFYKLVDDRSAETDAIEELEDMQSRKHELKKDLKKAFERQKIRSGEPAEFDPQIWEEKCKAIRGMQELWKQVTPKTFVRNIAVLGSDAKVYMKMLSIQLRHEQWPEWTNLQQMQQEQVDNDIVVDGDFNWKSPNRAFLRHTKNTYLDTDQGWCSRWCCDLFKTLIQDQKKVCYRVRWTSAAHIIGANLDDRLHIVKALYNTGQDSDVYNTAVGRAIQMQAWESVRYHWYWRVFCDIFVLICYFLIGAYLRGGASILEKMHIHLCGLENTPTTPPLWLLIVTGLFSLRSLITPFLELIAIICKFGAKVALLEFCSQWNMIMVAVEIFNASVILTIVFYTPPDEPLKECQGQKSCFMSAHIVFFMFAVFAKWGQLILNLLCTKMFGKNILPAINAMMRRESIAFIAFLILCVTASFQSYWTLPIKENMPDGDGRSHTLNTFMKIFRLDLLGDFDLWEMEGVDPVLQANVVNNTVVEGEVDDGEEDSILHDGLQLFFILCSTLFTIASMNVYVGVLGNLYDDCKSHVVQQHERFKANYIFKMLLIKTYWVKIFGDKLCGGGEENHVGYWIVSHDPTFMDEAETNEDVYERINKVDEKVDRLSEDLNTKLDAIMKHIGCPP